MSPLHLHNLHSLLGISDGWSMFHLCANIHAERYHGAQIKSGIAQTATPKRGTVVRARHEYVTSLSHIAVGIPFVACQPFPESQCFTLQPLDSNLLGKRPRTAAQGLLLLLAPALPQISNDEQQPAILHQPHGDAATLLRDL